MAKINIPGLHGGVSQQAPALRLPNQHEDATNVLFNPLHGIKAPRWGTRTYIEDFAEKKRIGYEGSKVQVLDYVETTDGKRWLIVARDLAANNSVAFECIELNSENEPVDYQDVIATGSYWGSVSVPRDVTRLSTVTILDTLIVVNQNRGVEFSANDFNRGDPAALVYFPSDVIEGQQMALVITVKGSSGATLTSATVVETVGAGDTAGTMAGHIVNNGSIASSSYINASFQASRLVAIRLTASGISAGATITIENTGTVFPTIGNLKRAPAHPSYVNPETFPLWVTTFPSYEQLPPYDPGNVWFELSSGYYVKYDNGTYVETSAPCQNIHLNPSTMPHELRYSSGTWSIHEKSDYGDFKRVAGDSTSAPLPEFIGRKISSVFFYRNRLGIIADNTISMSQVGEFYNWFPDTATEVLDTDPISVIPTSTKYHRIDWAVPFNKQLVLVGPTKQYVLHSGFEALSPKTIAIDEATSYTLDTQYPPLQLKSSLILLEVNGGYYNVLEYQVPEQEIATDATVLSTAVPQFVPVGYKPVYLPSENMVLFTRSSIPSDYTGDYNSTIDEYQDVKVLKMTKNEAGQYTQIAWSSWSVPFTTADILIVNPSTLLFLGYSHVGLSSGSYYWSYTYSTMSTQAGVHLDVWEYYDDLSTATYSQFSNRIPIDASTNKVYPTELVGGFEVSPVCPEGTPGYIGLPIDWSVELSPMLLRDDNGLPNGELQSTIEAVSFEWVGGEFTTQIDGQGLPTRERTWTPLSYTMESLEPGSSMEEPTKCSIVVMAPSRRAKVIVKGSDANVTQINNLSYSLDVHKDWG